MVYIILNPKIQSEHLCKFLHPSFTFTLKALLYILDCIGSSRESGNEGFLLLCLLVLVG